LQGLKQLAELLLEEAAAAVERASDIERLSQVVTGDHW
jgi:hypothetical protein